jgi:NAD+--asparagine ADP-ribosyltransferase
MLQDYYQYITNESRFDTTHLEDLNQSISNMNMNNKKQSILPSFNFDEKSKPEEKGYKSISINIGGASIYVPDTVGFDQESKGKSH